MKTGKIITATGIILAATVPYWILIPIASYLLEVVLIIVLIHGTIENRLKLLIAASVLGLAVGAIPGLALLPFSVFFPLWLKAVFPAVILGALIGRGWQAGRSFTAASVMGAAFILIMYIQGQAVLGQQIDLMNESMQSMISGTLTAQGYSAEVINEMIDKLADLSFLIKRLLPGMLILSGIGQLFIGFVLIEWYYTRRDSYFPGFGPFIYWKIPEKLLYVLGIALVARLIIAGVAEIAADNLLFILLFLYAVCGLALIEHLLRRMQLPTFIKIIFYFGLLLMQVPGLIAASVAGLFDSYFDFRKVRAHTLG